MNRRNKLQDIWNPISEEWEPHNKLRLTSEQRQEIADVLCSCIEDSRRAAETAYRQCARARAYYDQVMPPKTKPWVGSANINLPLIRSMVDSTRCNMTDMFEGGYPLWPKALNPDDEPYAHPLQKVLNGWSRASGARDMFRNAVHNALVDHAAIVKNVFVEEMAYTRSIEQHDLGDEEVQVPLDQPHVVERKTVVFKGPKPEVVPFADFIVYPWNATSLPLAIGMGQRIQMRRAEISQNIVAGVFDQDVDLERLLQTPEETPSGTASASPTTDDPSGTSTEQDDRMGFEVVLREADKLLNTYELCWKWPVRPIYYEDDAGNVLMDSLGRPKPKIDSLTGKQYVAEEWCLFVVAQDQRVLLRAEHYPYWDLVDAPYFDAIVPLPVPGRWYGQSMALSLFDLNVAINALINQLLNARSLQLNPAFFQGPGSSWDPSRQEFKPGMVIPRLSPTDIEPIAFPELPSRSVLGEIDQLWQMGVYISGQSPTMQGVEDPTGRTAFEVGTRLARATKRLMEMIRNMGSSLERIARQWISMCVQDYETTGESPWDIAIADNETRLAQGLPPLPTLFEKLSAERGEMAVFDFEFNENIGMTSEFQQMQIALQLFMFVRDTPFMQANPLAQWDAIAMIIRNVPGAPEPERLLGQREMADQVFAQWAATTVMPQTRFGPASGDQAMANPYGSTQTGPPGMGGNDVTSRVQ